MNRKFKSVSLLVLVGFLISCANKAAPVEIQPELQKLEVLHRVQELQRTVIAVHDAAPTKLSKADADIVVKFTLLANDLVSTSADGWKAKVKDAWVGLKKIFTPPPSLSTVWAVVDSLIMGLL